MSTLEERSGNVTYCSCLVSFLYELMRDHLPPGRVAELVQSSQDADVAYTNGWLAKYAIDLAKCLNLGDEKDRLSRSLKYINQEIPEYLGRFTSYKDFDASLQESQKSEDWKIIAYAMAKVKWDVATVENIPLKPFATT